MGPAMFEQVDQEGERCVWGRENFVGAALGGNRVEVAALNHANVRQRREKMTEGSKNTREWRDNNHAIRGQMSVYVCGKHTCDAFVINSG